MGYRDKVPFGILVGKTLKSVVNNDDVVNFETEDGEEYIMKHDQDCCESVRVDDIVGDLNDLIGSPIIRVEENSSPDRPEGIKDSEYGSYDSETDSETWTFYRIGTAKGTVVIRWYGSSNGYYSESVDFEKVR